MARWSRRIGSAFVAAALMVAALAPAQTPAPVAAPKPADAATPGDLRSPQEQNADLFRKFTRELLFLELKLEKSDRPEDKERAAVIKAALKLATQEGVETQFQKMIAGLAKGGVNLQQLDGIAGQDKQLQKALQDIMTVLMTDDSATQVKTERERIEKLLAETRELLRQQKTLRGMTESKRVDAERIAKDQSGVTERTKDLAKKMGGDPKPAAGKAPPETPKSEPKPASDAKPGEPAGADKPDAADPKGDPKAGPKDPAGEAKPGAPKPGEAKPPGDGKPGDPKPGETKPPGDKPPGDAAPKPAPKGEPKPDAQAKAEAKPSDGKPGGEGKPIKPKDDAQSAQAPPASPKPGGPPKEGEPGGPPPPGGQAQAPPPPPDTPGRKEVQSAIPHQQGSQKDLEAKTREPAGKQQDKAIEELAKAAAELEKRIKQLREQEMLGLLANLEARCGKMLSMQIEVYEATKAIDGVLIKNKGVKSNSEIQKSQQQADKETDIVAVADTTLKLLESEGSAVAFARVLEEVRQDMASVQRRLNDTYVGRDTQGIEENVIAMLKEMMQALKKAQDDVKQQQGQPPPPGGPPKQGDKGLLELVSELKLIRSLQVQVNGRTKGSAETYKGEQASDPIVRGELQQLSERQAKLQDMVNNIASGKNK